MKSFYLLIISLFLASTKCDPYYALLFDKNSNEPPTTNLPTEFGEKISKLCDGYQTNSSNDEKWESVIEEGNIRIIFQCSDGNNSWKIKLLSNYIKSFERNRPKRWYLEEQPNNFTCKDSYGRHIPMPLGVQRCFIQHRSIVGEQINNETNIYTITQESGTFAKPIQQISEYSCGDSYTWKPYSSPPESSSSNILNDQECAVKVSLTTMHFFCCCYSNGSQCGAVGNLTGHGLTCPQLSMNASLTVDESTMQYNETENVEERINAENLILQDECHMRITVKRPKRGPKLATSISLVKNDDDICESMFDKIPAGHNCHHFERQCYTDIDDELIYCCRFKYSGKRDASEDKILSIHSVYGDFVFGQFRNHLHRFRKCLRPYADNNDYCVYFYDKIMDKFVNIQVDENYKVSGTIKEKIQKFLTNANQNLIYIEGELNRNDKRVTGCEEANSLKTLPFWYRPTVAIFKCVTLESDGERCDDFALNQTIIEEVRKKVDDQYLCYNGNITQPSWDMYCFENLTSNLKNASDYNVTTTIGSRITNFNLKNVWAGDHFSINGIQSIRTFWCSEKENKDGRLCACASYFTQKSNRRSEKPCNDGNFVKNMHLIETSPEFVKENEPSKCVIPSTSEDDGRHECVSMPEKGSVQSCVMGMERGHHADIGCIREPNLSHLKSSHRMDHYDWHVYQICKEIFKPEEEAFRCVLRGNHLNHYTEYRMICCCRTDSCAAAYKHASKFKPQKTFDIFVHQPS